MFDEEDLKKPKEKISRNLEAMSINELQHYIEQLKSEIIRAEEDIKRKKDVFASADQFFKK